MILILEPEKLTARIIAGTVIIVCLISLMFGISFYRSKLIEFREQKAENVQLKSELDTQKELTAELTNELSSKNSQLTTASSVLEQLREKNKKLEPALTQCQTTVTSQKSTIKTYKDYYYYYLSNGK